MTDRFTGEPLDVPIVTRCARCNAPIYDGDEFVDISEPVCIECADEEDERIGYNCRACAVDRSPYDRFPSWEGD